MMRPPDHDRLRLALGYPASRGDAKEADFDSIKLVIKQLHVSYSRLSWYLGTSCDPKQDAQ